MRIYHTLKIGEYHTNYCEDYLINCEIGDQRILCAVMDGCSAGTDSHLASMLTGKILRKISSGLSHKEFISKETPSLIQLMESVIRQLFSELHTIKNTLLLEREELLNTLVIGIIDAQKRCGEFICVGDGLICINGQYFEFEQNDQPDYLGYHLEEDFEKWMENQQQKISVDSINDFSLSTDGIFTFKKFDGGIYEPPGNIIDYLLVDNTGSATEMMLHKKVLDIETEWGLKPSDDLAIIRGIL